MANRGDGQRKRAASFASSVPEEVEKITVTAETSQNSKTFVFVHEDHTLGNSLRHVLIHDPAVQFCGYSVPHPMEAKMHLRVQTSKEGGKLAEDALRDGLMTLSSMCDEISDCFDKAVSSKQQSMEED